VTVAAEVASRLAKAIDSKRVIAAEEELQAYAIDSLVPSVISRPVSAEEAAETVRFALAEKLALVPLGSRSKFELGMSPERFDIAVDMTGMKEIAHFDPGDLTLSVDAGMPLRELELCLKEKGQFLPLAVPCFESATIGGTIASGIDSALRLQYGAPRDFLIGAEFIDGTGQLCKSGGRVVKNVTGYDLHKLLIGSLGTLGTITRLNFRTFPLPAAFGGHLACFAKPEDALGYRHAIEKTGLPLSNLEVFSPSVAEMIQAILKRSEEQFPSELDTGNWCVYGSFEGNAGVVERIGHDLEKFAHDSGALQNRILQTSEDNSLGGMLREAFEWLRWASPANVLCRLTLPEMKPNILTALFRLAQVGALRSGCILRAAGILYFSVLAEKEDEETVAQLAQIAKSAGLLAAGENGHCTLLHASPLIKMELSGQNLARMNHDMQNRMKNAFDPSHIFAPGRVVGAI
jgi:glycolate oxidase FAD binding subunit